MPEINAYFPDGTIREAEIDHLPRTCPHCNHGVHTDAQFAFVRDDRDKLELIVACPRVECEHLILSHYDRNQAVHAEYYRFNRSEGFYRERAEFSDDIEQVSERFASIYSHAEQAETQGLDEICGPGYRKALEFLVKDFAILRNPDDAEAIATTISLGTVISDYIPDPRIQEIARRAAWLGNDETHYQRRWDMGIAELKALITLVVNHIDNELIADRFIDEMPDGGPIPANEDEDQ